MMAVDKDICELYLITPETINDVTGFCRQLDDVLATEMVACVQLRLKGADDATFEETGLALLPVCHKHGVPMLVNDRADIAVKINADGVHLGQEDGDVVSARTLLGHDKDIGVTCHGSKQLAYDAGDAGANYVAFGAFFPSKTKPEAKVADKEILTHWDETTDIPCVAIGGITPENCREVADAGAHFVAICSAVWEYCEGPKAAIQAFHKALAD